MTLPRYVSTHAESDLRQEWPTGSGVIACDVNARPIEPEDRAWALWYRDLGDEDDTLTRKRRR